jgi:hypothetical protein
MSFFSSIYYCMGASYSRNFATSDPASAQTWQRQELLLRMPVSDLRTKALQGDQFTQEMVNVLQLRGEKVPDELRKRGYARLANANSVASRAVLARAPVSRRADMAYDVSGLNSGYPQQYPQQYSDAAYGNASYNYAGGKKSKKSTSSPKKTPKRKK